MSFNDILNWGLSALGIVVSVVFFWIQIRQSIGVRTERRARANDELIALLVTRLVLEDYLPSLDELHKIRDGLAVRKNIDPTALISDQSILSALYFEVIENNYITAERRKEILKKIEKGFSSQSDVDTPNFGAESKEEETISLQTIFTKIASQESSFLFAFVVSIGLGVTVSGFSAALSDQVLGQANYFFENVWKSLGSVILQVGLGTLVLGGAIAAILLQRTLQQRRSLERISQKTEEATPWDFERRVISYLRDRMPNKFSLDTENNFPFADAIVVGPKGRVVIEVKYLRPGSPVSQKTKDRWRSQLAQAVNATGAVGGLIVVPSDLSASWDVEKIDGYRIVKFKVLYENLLEMAG